jgi:hypothetical protein
MEMSRQLHVPATLHTGKEPPPPVPILRELEWAHSLSAHGGERKKFCFKNVYVACYVTAWQGPRSVNREVLMKKNCVYTKTGKLKKNETG